MAGGFPRGYRIIDTKTYVGAGSVTSIDLADEFGLLDGKNESTGNIIIRVFRTAGAGGQEAWLGKATDNDPATRPALNIDTPNGDDYQFGPFDWTAEGIPWLHFENVNLNVTILAQGDASEPGG